MRVARSLGTAVLLLCSARASAQGSIAGTVYDSLRTRARLANATVVLVEQSRYTTTDSRGRFTFDSVPDGRYTVGFTHAVLDSLDVQGPIIAVSVLGAKRATVALATPSSATMYALLCPGGHERSTGMVVGRVRGADGQTPVPDAAVTTEWKEYSLGGGHTASTIMRASTRTNAGGIYLLCNVPTDVAVEVKTELGAFAAGPTALAMEGRLFSRVDFSLSQKDTVVRAAAEPTPVTRGAQQLRAVTVEASANAPSWMTLSGFDERRGHGLGAYVTAEDIGKHNYFDLASVFRSIPGVRVECNAEKHGIQGVPCRPLVQMLGISDFTSIHCTPNFYVDGAPFKAGYADVDASIPIASVKGIEVYSNPGTIPAQYDLTSSTGCGSIVIWTH